MQVAGYGEICYDIGYGGTFYALAEVEQFGLDLAATPIHRLIAAADALSSAVKASVTLSHPESPDLAFLYGTILTDGKNEFSEEPTANLCVFADCQVGDDVMYRYLDSTRILLLILMVQSTAADLGGNGIEKWSRTPGGPCCTYRQIIRTLGLFFSMIFLT